MLFDELRRYLSNEEIAAIDYLESIGFEVVTEGRLEDCKKKDGSRIRTFSKQGRFDLMVCLKSVAGRAVVDEPEEVEESEPRTEEGAQIIDNFWMDRDRWIRMSRDAFFVLVTEEAVDDLRASPVDVQDDVQEKFLRFFSANDWPI